jgi:hypothetical protein
MRQNAPCASIAKNSLLPVTLWLNFPRFFGTLPGLIERPLGELSA